jgi:hypothetical protein
MSVTIFSADEDALSKSIDWELVENYGTLKEALERTRQAPENDDDDETVWSNEDRVDTIG